MSIAEDIEAIIAGTRTSRSIPAAPVSRSSATWVPMRDGPVSGCSSVSLLLRLPGSPWGRSVSVTLQTIRISA
jgi:hypothetical protein